MATPPPRLHHLHHHSYSTTTIITPSQPHLRHHSSTTSSTATPQNSHTTTATVTPYQTTPHQSHTHSTTTPVHCPLHSAPWGGGLQLLIQVHLCLTSPMDGPAGQGGKKGHNSLNIMREERPQGHVGEQERYSVLCLCPRRTLKYHRHKVIGSLCSLPLTITGVLYSLPSGFLD